MEQNEKRMDPGREWAIWLKPGGCILVLLVSVLCVVMMFRSGPEKIDGYAPPESDAYYTQHLDELQIELETNVFPELDGILDCENNGEALVITLEQDEFIKTRAAILQYYGRELFVFEQR